MTESGDNHGRIEAINGNLLTVSFAGSVRQNEIGHALLRDRRLPAEVVRIRAGRADLQVFEDTAGLRVGDRVDFSGELLSAELGPGLLGTLYDGLQNPLHRLAEQCGYFLQRGVWLSGLDEQRRWEFQPLAGIGDVVRAADSLGRVPEGPVDHRIMVPFDLRGDWRVASIRPGGGFTVRETIAELENEAGVRVPVCMSFRWPVRRPIRAYEERLAPTEPLTTRIRIIDAMFPVAKGGTYCIPGPFGAGKTVLQQITSRFAEVDVVIVAACGERAGEVVETIREFPKIKDPRTGRSLMERTIIICNTSAMPVAAREASVYTAATLAEYYRQMGLDVLLLADSTSRWAQAMRERSGRLEEIPGEEAFPAYLESTIADFYERAGRVRLRDGRFGSVTIGGTVSPAGGNFEEPVTQATLKVVGAFHALSRERSDARRYPAIDPLESWSHYRGIVEEARVREVRRWLSRAHEIEQMMKVVGDEGTSLEDHVMHLKGGFFDDVFLQQNAFDPVDAASGPERQRRVFTLLEEILAARFRAVSRQAARGFFQQLRQMFLDLNGLGESAPAFDAQWDRIRGLVDESIDRKGARGPLLPDAKALLESELDSDVIRRRRMAPAANRELLLNAEDEKDDK